MKKLQCEICGGQLMMKDGIAECQSCGMQFSKEEVKKMVVELSGPIQIDGEVKVTGMDDADALYQRAKDFVKLGDHSSAKKNYTEMTTKYPGDYRGWVGLAEESGPSWVFKEEWDEGFDTQFCPVCGIGPCAIADRYHCGTSTVRVRLPKKFDLEKIAHEKDRSLTSAEIHMSKASAVADISLHPELNKTRNRLLKEYGEIADRMEVKATAWNQARESEITKAKKLLLEKEYWKNANATFLNRHFEMKAVLPLLTGLTWKEIENQCHKACDNVPTIKEIRSWCGDHISICYVYSHRAPHSKARSVPCLISIKLLPSYQTTGDIRPFLDGIKTGFTVFNRTYSFVNDPNKDKGPTFGK